MDAGCGMSPAASTDSPSNQTVSNPWLTMLAPEHHALTPDKRSCDPRKAVALTRASGGSTAHTPHRLRAGGVKQFNSARIASASLYLSYRLTSPSTTQASVASICQLMTFLLPSRYDV